MKKIKINHCSVLRLAAAICAMALGSFISGSAQAAPSWVSYTVNGTTVTGSGTNASTAYFQDPVNTTAYTVTRARRQPW